MHSHSALYFMSPLKNKLLLFLSLYPWKSAPGLRECSKRVGKCMLSPRPRVLALQPLLAVPGQVGDAVRFLHVGKVAQTPGSSRMTLPGQPRSPRPPWADRTLEHIPGWGGGPAHLRHWARPQCFLSDELASSIIPATPRCAPVSAARAAPGLPFHAPGKPLLTCLPAALTLRDFPQSLVRLAQGLLPPWTSSSLSKSPLEGEVRLGSS